MEHETIIYYYPVRENAGQYSAVAKKHWWQEAKLTSFCISKSDASQTMMSGRQEQDGSRYDFQIYACPVPVFYYKKKNWKEQTLCEAMEKVLYQMEGMTDTFLAFGMEKLLPGEMLRRWHPRMETVKRLTALRLAQKIEAQGRYPRKAVVMLGKMQDADWQMEMTWELLLPYLPKINQCVIRYDPAPGLDISEELGSFLDDYYYEYGLVVQTERNGAGSHTLSGSSNSSASSAFEWQMEDSGLYLDFRKDNLYRCIVKYLDTMVKNSYY